MKTGRWKPWTASILALVLTCFYPCMFLFSQNAGEANASDMLPFFLLFLATAAAGLILSGMLFRDVSRAAFFTCLGMLVVINLSMITDMIKGHLPWFQDKMFLALAGLVLLVLLVLFLRKKPNMTSGCAIMALTFGALTLFSLLNAVPKLYLSAAMKKELQQQAMEVDVALTGEKRNVYYLLFDEYGGDENLLTYFDFDNSDFYQELEQRGFSISRSSRNTESCWTDTIVSNLLNLNYVADDEMPARNRRDFLKNPLLFQIFRRNGYSINLINHRAYLRDRTANELTQGQTEDNISEYLFERSIYCKLPVIKDYIQLWLFKDYRDHYRDPLGNALSVLVNSVYYKQNEPTLTVSYIQSPHAPFVYNADGSIRDLQTGWNWKDKTLYPGQLQYINTLILEAVDNIQREDPDAVILLLSDHGARVPLHMVEQFGGPRFDAEKETPVMQSMLCCAYIPGRRLDIEGDTGINMTCKVLNEVFGTDLPIVPPQEGYVLDDIFNAHPSPEPSKTTPEPEPSGTPMPPTPSIRPKPPETPPPPPTPAGKKDHKGPPGPQGPGSAPGKD